MRAGTVSNSCYAQLTQNLWLKLLLQPPWIREGLFPAERGAEVTLGYKIKLCVILRMKLTLAFKQVTKSQVEWQKLPVDISCVLAPWSGTSPTKVFASAVLVSEQLPENTVLLSWEGSDRKAENKDSYSALKKLSEVYMF